MLSLCKETGNYDLAKKMANQCIYASSQFIPCYLHLASVFLREGNPELAMEQCHKGLNVLSHEYHSANSSYQELQQLLQVALDQTRG
jgi:Tetratricopeptide repeat